MKMHGVLGWNIQFILTNREKMADDYSDTDGEAGRTFEVITFSVAGGEHGEDELKRDQELHNQGMTHWDTLVYLFKDGGQEEVCGQYPIQISWWNIQSYSDVNCRIIYVIRTKMDVEIVWA